MPMRRCFPVAAVATTFDWAKPVHADNLHDNYFAQACLQSWRSVTSGSTICATPSPP